MSAGCRFVHRVGNDRADRNNARFIPSRLPGYRLNSFSNAEHGYDPTADDDGPEILEPWAARKLETMLYFARLRPAQMALPIACLLLTIVLWNG